MLSAMKDLLHSCESRAESVLNSLKELCKRLNDYSPWKERETEAQGTHARVLTSSFVAKAPESNAVSPTIILFSGGGGVKIKLISLSVPATSQHK